MGALDLAAKATINITPAEAALGKLDARMSKFTDKVEHKLSKKISKYFGAGFVTGALISPVHKIVESFFEGPKERAEKLKEESEALGVTVEQYQMIELAAKGAKKSVKEWIEEVKNHKVPLGEAIQEIQKYRDQVKYSGSDINRILSGGVFGAMAKKAADLSESIQQQFESEEIAKQLSKGRGGLLWRLTHPTEMAQYMELARQSLANAKIAHSGSNEDLAKALTGKGGGGGSFRGDFQVNELQRIGAFVGGSSGPEKTLEKIAENTEKTAEAAKTTAEEIKSIAENRVQGSLADFNIWR